MIEGLLLTILGIYAIVGLVVFALLTNVTNSGLWVRTAMSAIWPLVVWSVFRYAFAKSKVQTVAKHYKPYLDAIRKDLLLNEIQKIMLRNAVYSSMKQGIFPPVITKDGETTTFESLGIDPKP